MQADTERAETEEEIYVQSQNTGSAALTAIKTAKKKTELVARDKFEELDVQKQNADDEDTQHQHHHHHQEQARCV